MHMKLAGSWTVAELRGLFRYKETKTETTMLPSKYTNP